MKIRGKSGWFWPSLAIVVGCASALYHGLRIHPGWLFWDSASQWTWAYALLDGFDTNLKVFGVSSQWPLFNTFIKVFFLKLGLSPGAVAILQGSITNLVLYYVGFSFLPWRWLAFVVGTAFCMSPLIINYGLFHSGDSPAGILILLLTAFVSRFCRGFRTGYLIAAIGVFMVGVLIRYNFASLLPVLLVMPAFAYLKASPVWLRSLLAVVAGVIALGTVIGVRIFDTHQMDTAFHGVLMRNLSFLREKEDPCIRKSIEGVFHDPDHIFDDACYRTVLCKEIYWNIKKEGSTREQLRCYFEFAAKDPQVWLRNNFIFIGHYLGIQRPMDQGDVKELINNTPHSHDSFRMVFDDQRMRYWSELEGFSNGWKGFIGRPIYLMMISFLFSLLAWRLRRDPVPALFFISGTLYYGVFLIDGPDCVFRYYYPSFLCFAISGILGGARIISRERVLR